MEAKPAFYPLRFKPVYQTYLWGGNRLREQYGRSDSPDGIVAESWEVTDRPDGMSIVENGPFAGKSLRELIEAYGGKIVGRDCKLSVFPLLIKVLDAAKTLSVQVHPNDETALKYGGEAKTEMWYVLDAEEGAVVYCGLKEGVTPEAFRKAIDENTLEEWLTTIPVQKGDAIFVPGGRVHAIGAGCLLLEVQQNSNTTYRIYDWGRVDSDGKSRELHVDQAMQVSSWDDRDSALQPCDEIQSDNQMSIDEILESDYFRLERLVTSEEVDLENDGDSFEVVFAVNAPVVLQGGGEAVEVAAGSSALIPAGARDTLLVPTQPHTEVVLIRLP